MEYRKKRTTPKYIPKYHTELEINAMLEHAKQYRNRDFITLLTLWRTGMRVHDLTNLKRKDIDFVNNVILIRDSKGHKDRVIPLETELGNLLGLLTDRMRPDDRVFPFTDRTVWNMTHKHGNTHPHAIRHSFAVYCLKNHLNLRSLQKILGHSDLSTTSVYLDVTVGDIKEDFNKIRW